MVRSVTTIKLPFVHGYRDRHGLMRYYVRRRGARGAALPGAPMSAEFMAAYHAALGGLPKPAAAGVAGRSLAALVEDFKRSPKFGNLSAGAKKTYGHVLKRIVADDGHRSVADLPDDKARKIIEEIGADRPAMANLTKAVMRRLFGHAISIKWRKTNPFVGLETYRLGTHHTWTDAQLAAYEARWPLGTRERVAFDLLFYTAQRIGDVVLMRRADIIKGAIHVTQQKTGVALRIHVHPALDRSLKAYGIKGRHLVGRLDGKPISGVGLSQIVIDAVAKAELPQECVPHGLRKAAMRLMAEGGLSAKMIASVSGHRTLKEVERYTDAADQAGMARAAIASLPDRNRS